MKQTRIHIIGSVALAAMLVSCAGLNKMKKNAASVQYTVTPSVLEAHAGKVDLGIKAQVPAKFWDKKASAEITPVLVYEGGETVYPSVKIQGERVQGNDKMIPYATGGQYTYNNTVPFNDKMRVSNLVIRMKATKGAKTVTFDDYKIAEGVIATSTLVADQGAMAGLGKDNFQRIVSESQAAEILYLIQQAEVRQGQLKKEDIKALNDYIAAIKATENKNFKDVTVSAYASPDGAMDLNTKLADNREKTASKYVASQLKKAKVEGGEALLKGKTTAEDWDGFKKAMEASNIQDKELILRVLSMYTDPEVREKEIKNMATTFKVIAEEILPPLRRSVLTVNAELIGKSDAELKELSASNPSSLNLEELLYAATLTQDKDAQLAIYKEAAAKYPNCWRAVNNVGVALYAKGDVAGAKTQFEKAASIKADAVVENNLGVIALINKDYAKAEEHFGKAAGTGAELDNNLGIVAIHKGDYEAAIRYFGNSTSCNAALAKILAGKNDAALSTLNANTMEVGLKYYLKAVVGANKGENDLMFENLRKATSLDAKWKTYAKTDMVFGKFFQDATFKSIVE